jgi:hypothetical protein
MPANRNLSERGKRELAKGGAVSGSGNCWAGYGPSRNRGWGLRLGVFGQGRQTARGRSAARGTGRAYGDRGGFG